MRVHAVALFALTACASGQDTPDAMPVDAHRIDAIPPDAAPPDASQSVGFFLDDSASDFAAGTLDGAFVESWGAVAPIAYDTGALRARASDTGTFTSAATETWDQVEAMTMTGVTAPARGLVFDWGSGTPQGLGLTSGDTFTIAYDGEIFLDAGTWSFDLLCDDHGFLEIAQPGGATFTRVASADWPNDAIGSFTAAADGWYPIHVATSEQTGGAQVKLYAIGPSGGPAVGPSRQRLRFAASGMTGLDALGFAGDHLVGVSGATVDATAPAGADWGTGAPADLGIASADDFSMRWAGQLRIDDGGDYTFRYDSDDGQRLWIDGTSVLDSFDAAIDQSTSAIHLEPGWHDVVADQSELTGSAKAMLGVASGPGLVGASLPVDHLRPVEGRGERIESGEDASSRPIPDLGEADSLIAIDAPAGAKTLGVDVGWTFDHPYQSDLQITLIAPDGSSTVLRDGVDGSGTTTQRVHSDALDQSDASGVWTLRVADTVSLDTGTLHDFVLTVHHATGTPPITQVATYTSSVKDLGPDVHAYTGFSWQATLGGHSLVKAYVRSGDSATHCTQAPWSTAIVDASAGVPPVFAARYFQYQLELDSDGDSAASVDWVRLDTTEVVP